MTDESLPGLYIRTTKSTKGTRTPALDTRYAAVNKTFCISFVYIDNVCEMGLRHDQCTISQFGKETLSRSTVSLETLVDDTLRKRRVSPRLANIMKAASLSC